MPETPAHLTCRTCGCPINRPMRDRDAEGTIRFGCVDADHDGALVDLFDQLWHDRPEAVSHREYVAQKYGRLTLAELHGELAR